MSELASYLPDIPTISFATLYSHLPAVPKFLDRYVIEAHFLIKALRSKIGIFTMKIRHKMALAKYILAR